MEKDSTSSWFVTDKDRAVGTSGLVCAWRHRAYRIKAGRTEPQLWVSWHFRGTTTGNTADPASCGKTCRSPLTMDNTSETSRSSPEAAYQSQVRRASRTDRPCDTCRKRKSRCVRETGQDKCVLCTFHHRDCTYVDEPSRRKRKRAEATGDTDAPTDREDGSVVPRCPSRDGFADDQESTGPRRRSNRGRTRYETMRRGPGPADRSGPCSTRRWACTVRHTGSLSARVPSTTRSSSTCCNSSRVRTSQPSSAKWMYVPRL